MSVFSNIFGAVFVVVAIWTVKKLAGPKLPGKRIPGPKGLPIIGNLLDVPLENEYKVYSQWQKKYGDIIQLNVMGGKPVIILNSPRLAVEMLSKKSAIYSSRPHFALASDLGGFRDILVLLPYNDKFRATRRMMHQIIGTRTSVERFEDVFLTETRIAVRRLLKEPENYMGAIRQAVGAIILMISHGYKVTSEHDGLIRIADSASDQLGVLLTPGKFAVTILPFLKYLPTWFPGGGLRQMAVEWRDAICEMTDKSYNYVLDQMAAGTAIPNFVTNLIEGKNISPQQQEEIKWAASSLYTGGADTPVSTMASFLLAMTMYPDVLKKCQEEMDRVIGTDRLPTFADRDRLPYMEATVKEVLRWGPVTPLGAPHCVEKDDIQDGYFIPKGSTILANLWHFLNDPEVYPNPDVFDPDRLFDRPGRPAQPDPYDFAFGYGRRSCPGDKLAQSLMFSFCATVAAVVKIEKVVENGVVQEPTRSYKSGVLAHPLPFKTSLKPRSAKTEALINAEA